MEQGNVQQPFLFCEHCNQRNTNKNALERRKEKDEEEGDKDLSKWSRRNRISYLAILIENMGLTAVFITYEC